MKQNPLSESFNTPFNPAKGLLKRERESKGGWVGMCWTRATICLFLLSVFDEELNTGKLYIFQIIIISMTVISLWRPGSYYR